MKKITLIIASLFGCAVAGEAQITVTNADIASPGKLIIQGRDTTKSLTPGSINPGPAGANQTWDFSNLLSDVTDTMLFTNPAWVPGGSLFPSANLAVVSGSDSSANFVENISTGLFVDGAFLDPFGTGAFPIMMSPPEQLAKFPDTYNTTFWNSNTVDITIPYSGIAGVDSVRLKEYTEKASHTDGWGTVITPLGSFPCLRHRDEVVKTDSIWAHLAFPPTWVSAGAPTIDTTWHFSWWANSIGYTLVEFDSTTADTIRGISWLKVTPVAGSVNEDFLTTVTGLYPNPSQGIFMVENTKGSFNAVKVYNIFGEMVYQTNNTTSKESIDLSDASDGVYVVKVYYEDGIAVKKITLKH